LKTIDNKDVERRALSPPKLRGLQLIANNRCAGKSKPGVQEKRDKFVMDTKKMGLEKSELPVERRAKKRFVMEREIRYRVLEQDKIIAVGSGKTTNLSSNGVAFVTEGDLPVGSFIEVSIAWPALLENRCPLQLIGFGRVLRSACGTVACTLEQYEFRTLARVVPESAWSLRSDQKLRRWAEAVARA
jgi:hypothetical protein